MCICSIDLRGSCLLDRSLGTVVVAILLRVGEFLGLEDLKFSVLLDKSNDAERVVGHGDTVGCSTYGCGLRRD